MKTTPQEDIRQCKYCQRTFKKKSNTSRKNWNERCRYCSLSCCDLDKVGKPTWNTGIKIDRIKYPKFGHLIKHSKETIDKLLVINKENAKKHPKSFFVENQKKAIKSGIRNHSYHGTLGKKGELSATWLGDNATYNSKHRWIQKNWKKTGICHRCGIQARPYGKCLSGTHWHNINKDYNRDDTTGWVELCPKCHRLTHKEECN